MAEEDRRSLFCLLVEQYQEVKAHLVRKVGSSNVAEDAIQDTYVRLQGMTLVPEVENPRPYLFKIVENVAVDRLRNEARRERAKALWEADSHVRSAPSAENSADGRERLRLLAGAIDELPPRCRDVFLLHKFEGLSYGEIARRLDISKSMVEKHVMKALARCRDKLSSGE